MVIFFPLYNLQIIHFSITADNSKVNYKNTVYPGRNTKCGPVDINTLNDSCFTYVSLFNEVLTTNIAIFHHLT